MLSKIKEWFQERFQGYVLEIGQAKFLKGFISTAVGAIGTLLASAKVLAITEFLQAHGVTYTWLDGILTVQITVAAVVTSVFAGVVALVMNFVLRKKPA